MDLDCLSVVVMMKLRDESVRITIRLLVLFLVATRWYVGFGVSCSFKMNESNQSILRLREKTWYYNHESKRYIRSVLCVQMILIPF